MSEIVEPKPKAAKLIVVAAFDTNDEGDFSAVYGPAPQQSEQAAIRVARNLAENGHTGVIAWVRDADPVLGDYGPPTVLFLHGDVPDME